jgi:muramoyltetrapeptide carboxypeptidase LdcA involved in peptidoglycan recycling
LIKPLQLKKGDMVAVVAPSSATDLKSVQNGELKIRALGLEPVMFPTVIQTLDTYRHVMKNGQET